MFQPGQTANIPSRMKQPHGHKRHWQRRYKNNMTPPRSSAASKDDQKENSLLESWQGHRILAASEVQPSFLFGHMLAAPPTQQVPSQVLRTRNRADKKAMANPGEWGAPTSGYLKAKSQAVVQRSNSYRCLLVSPSILNLERKGQYKIILL